MLKKNFIYTAKNKCFTVEIKNQKIENEIRYIGIIKTNCEQKVYDYNELLVVTGKIVKDLPTFGLVKKIKNYNQNEIEFVSFIKNEVQLKNGNIIKINYIDDEIEFEFFNELFFEKELKNFIKNLDDYIKE
jgi:hypothetical protein